MTTRRQLLIMAGALLAPSASVAQQQTVKVYRIGYIGGRPAEQEVFRRRLRELGYVDGQNVLIEWRSTEGQPGGAPAAAAELVRLKVDCIAANGVASIRAAMQATSSIPIVMVNVDADPVELGFVASLARPGGNVTGFTANAHELAGKRLALLRELVPNAKRVGMLVNAPPGNAPPGDAQMAHYRGTESTARKVGMEVRLFAVRSVEELERLFPRTADWRPEILSVFSGGWFYPHRARIIDWVARMKLPAIYSNTIHVAESGALMAYSDDGSQRNREVAGYVAKILSGVRPGDLPVQQPTKFELAINMKTAKSLGLTIPQSILMRADRVIE